MKESLLPSVSGGDFMKMNRSNKWRHGLVLLMGMIQLASAQYNDWQFSGAMWLLTTPEGANLPAGATETDFPLLVRLHKESFNFSQAKANGEDLRISAGGKPLSYQIEHWDSAAGTASIWVRVPSITGNSRQAIRLHWGKSDASSESNGAAVFSEANGFLSVWHMTEPVKDEVGTLESKDVGTTPTLGMIGPARNFAGKQGIHCGEAITKLPSGASPHSTEVWYQSAAANMDIVCWGQEGTPAGKVRMQIKSPAHIYVDSDGGSIHSSRALPKSEWIQVVHTYNGEIGQIYVNGQPDVADPTRTTMKILNPAKMWIGGWRNNYDFVGDIDEVRVSKVARSADWVRLAYENQKALQTLTGHLVVPGKAFAVSVPKINLLEGKSVTVKGKADGAQKVYWVLKKGSQETIVAVDQFSFTLDAGRVTGDQAMTLQFKAVFADDVKIKDIPILIKDDIQDPVFTLKAPASWDGRSTLEVVPQITNLPAMQAKGAGVLKTEWRVSGIAAVKQNTPDKLVLTRAQNSGKMTVKATLSNGGEPLTQSVVISVTEPKTDAWVVRTPATDEKPENDQFYARDDKNEGTLHYNGTLAEAADTVFLNVFADDKPYLSESAKVAADKSYAFAVKLKPGMIKYKVEFGTKSGATNQVLNTVTNLVCGDAYLIQGQSNALSTDTREQSPPETSEWIRSYGRPDEKGNNAPAHLWCYPVWKAGKEDKAELGYWGMELAKRLVASQKMPIFIINGAVGGTRIDQHMRNEANPTDLTTIYGRALWRAQQAKLTHGIRGILWHQGESSQGSDGPTGDYDWKNYEDYFVELAAAWQRDFPNFRHTYTFQIWPNACSMAGRAGGGDKIREIQRSLPRLYSNLSVMTTVGISPPGGCHYPLAGWAEFARLIQPLIERDFYGKKPTESITPADLKQAYFTSAAKDTIVLEFDQPVIWMDALAGQIYLDGAKDQVASGSVTGNVLTLKLKAPSQASRVSYLKETDWSQKELILGNNGIAALTFCDVPLPLAKPAAN
jgi:Concanavalin A-like lectin/glucanases superfamily/Domain of unknown function (DUF2341)/Carbohydrate esterase, sialic acid-specific acetylesterase